MEALIVITLVIVAGILITIFMTKSYRDVSLSFDRSLCRTSAIAAESTTFVGIDSPFTLNGCDTRVVDIQYGKESRKVDGRLLRIKTESAEEIAKVISDELAGCAWQFSEGEINPFGNYAEYGDHVRCVICSEVTFDPQVVSNMQTIDLSTYMWSNKYTSKEALNPNKPYNEILGFSTQFPPLATEKDSYPVDYSIVFGLGQENAMDNWVTDTAIIAGSLGFAGGCVKGAATGASIGAAFEGIGAIPGGIIGCLVVGLGVGGTVGGGTYYGGSTLDDAIGDSQGETRYFEVVKSYDYFFVKDHQKKEGFMSAFAIVPSESVEDVCKRLY